MVLTNVEAAKLKVPELKKELKIRGLSTTGNKIELLERLQDALKSPELSTESLGSDILEEDLLNDEFDEQHDASDSLASDIDKVLEESPISKDLKRQNSTENGVRKTSKKIKLNREAPILEETSEDKSMKEDEKVEEKQKVVKLSDLSAKDRLEMRAKKFGAPITVNAKRAARAERFGSNGSDLSNPNAVKPTLDVLQKRAERFGGSVSKVMTNLESKEKLEKRKARFGNGTDK